MATDFNRCFAQDGFYVQNDVIPRDEIDGLLRVVQSAKIQSLLDAKGQHDRGVHLSPITTLDDNFKAMACDARILDRVAELVGDDIELQNSKLAVKPPIAGAGQFAWHQDLRFFPHTTTDVVTVMLMLDDATPENGCMYMVPGSKELGILPHDLLTGECTAAEHWADPERLVAITPNSGGISIHHGRTLHYSPPTSSGSPRRSLIFVYRAADSYQLAGPIFSDTGWLVRGQKPNTVRCGDLALTVKNLPITDPAVHDAYCGAGKAAAAWNAQ